jgi:hypothetical protein
MTLATQIQKNQVTIGKLTSSMMLWLGTPHAQNPAIRARILDLQDATLHRLQELEIEGQNAKIASMEKVVALLKDGTEPTTV